MAERGSEQVTTTHHGIQQKAEGNGHLGSQLQDLQRNKDTQFTSDGSEPNSRERTPPPLPPRPRTTQTSERPQSSGDSLRIPRSSTQPPLRSTATTALSVPDVHTQSHGGDELVASSTSRQPSYGAFKLGGSRRGSDTEETASVVSYAPTLGAGNEVESILGDILGDQFERHLGHTTSRPEDIGPQEQLFIENPIFEEAFDHEFDALDDVTSDGLNEEAVAHQWRSKLKHFLILSSAGKPVWSRHGSDQIISSSIGVIQTIISFYQAASDVLKGFTAGDARFVILSKGSLNLVAISRIGESDQQLRVQLEALYMQILSTLTLPVLERMFKARASIDLRRPLHGTEKLLSALADGFTRGSPSTLLQALECLKLRKSHRNVINNTMLKVKCDNLLYGLIVAGGRLVSVVRPRKHSLHPGDLHLIFNMLFEAGSVKAGDGENWIPLCLPGFNNTGYVYMYVSFLNLDHPEEVVTERPPSSSSEGDDEVAILLISTNKESFYDFRQMRDHLVQQLRKNGSLEIIQLAVRKGRPSCTDIIPGTVLRHFLYKSRGNVQFLMPSLDPYLSTPIIRRNLLTLYITLNAAIHTKPIHPKIYHSSTSSHISLAWSTPVFELYAIAPGNTPRVALSQAANRIVQWVRREEERVFIIGGAVF